VRRYAARESSARRDAATATTTTRTIRDAKRTAGQGRDQLSRPRVRDTLRSVCDERCWIETGGERRNMQPNGMRKERLHAAGVAEGKGARESARKRGDATRRGKRSADPTNECTGRETGRDLRLHRDLRRLSLLARAVTFGSAGMQMRRPAHRLTSAATGEDAATNPSSASGHDRSPARPMPLTAVPSSNLRPLIAASRAALFTRKSPAASPLRKSGDFRGHAGLYVCSLRGN